MKKKLGLNAVMNIVKSIIGMLFPLITFPYVSRVLSVSNIGKVNYANSIISYFVLLAMLGIQVYATREGARIRNDKKKIEMFVSEIFTLNVVTAITSIVVFILLLNFTDVLKNYKTLLCIFAIEIPLVTIGSDWINSIYEDYFYITVRTIGFQILSLILIFLFVRERNDYYQYAFCLVISAYGSGILNTFYTRRYCKKHIVFDKNIFKHLKPVLVLFATNLAALIYSNADTTMLGLMTTDYHVGIYTTAAKVYNIFKQLIFAIVIVCLPHFSYIVANETREKYETLANLFFRGVVLLAVPIAFGLYFLSNPIIKVLAGNEYMEAAYPLRILSFAILFAILAYFIMQLVLLPNQEDTIILRATLISGGINIIANFFLIPCYFEKAAAFTTVISEFLVFGVVYCASRKILKLHIGIKNIISMILSCGLMGLDLYFVNSLEMASVMTLIVGTISGAVIYFIMLIILKNEIIFEILQNLKKMKR